MFPVCGELHEGVVEPQGDRRCVAQRFAARELHPHRVLRGRALPEQALREAEIAHAGHGGYQIELVQLTQYPEAFNFNPIDGNHIFYQS